ncbi:MAG: hypothetical protein JWO63_2392 [Frankiales bacterium]|jgi:uncharacterized protein (DUF1697 family)|nr:hypothetical protein [Frankiales bacterium]
MTRYVAFLRAVNVGQRTVAMATARRALEELGLADVGSYINSGNLLFTATGKSATHQTRIRTRLEEEFGFEITTFLRTKAEVRASATAKPFGVIEPGHTHFVLLTLTPLTAAEQKSAEALSNSHDEVVLLGRDLHWLIRSKSTETTLGPKEWKSALPENPTTARNTTMMAKLLERL